MFVRFSFDRSLSPLRFVLLSARLHFTLLPPLTVLLRLSVPAPPFVSRYTLGPNLLPINQKKSRAGEPPSLDDMQRIVLEAEAVNLIMEVLIVCPRIAFGGPPGRNDDGLGGGDGAGGAVSSGGTHFHSRRSSIDDMILGECIV